MAGKKTTTIKTLQKWEEELKSKFWYDLNGDKVFRIQYNNCIKWEQHIKSCKNFFSNWIKPSRDSVSKDSVEKHVEALQHKEAKRLETKSLLGAEAYQENVVTNSSIAKHFLSPSNEDREGLCIKMKTVYHVTKNGDPYTDYGKLLKLQTKNGVRQLLKSKTQVCYATNVEVLTLALLNKMLCTFCF